MYTVIKVNILYRYLSMMLYYFILFTVLKKITGIILNLF